MYTVMLLMAMRGNELNKRRDAMPSDATPDTTPFWYPFDFFPGLRIIIYIFPLLQKKLTPFWCEEKANTYKYVYLPKESQTSQ